MKSILLITIILSVSKFSIAQFYEHAKVYPDSTRLRIEEEVEKEAIKFEKGIDKEYRTTEAIIFSVDTFKIYLTNSKRQDYDFSTQGMNNSVNEMSQSYDKLMNKYYSRLLKLLEPKDKELLISSQKAWIKFRDLENKLIWNMIDDKYTTGGTIQTNFATDDSFELVKTRTEQIFHYYNAIIEKKETR